jgi:hypothetical protein
MSRHTNNRLTAHARTVDYPCVGRRGPLQPGHHPLPSAVVGRGPGEADHHQRLVTHAPAGRRHQEGDDGRELVGKIPDPLPVGQQRPGPVPLPVDEVPGEYPGPQRVRPVGEG